MIIRDIQRVMEVWAPPDVAWERDNVGLQVGDPETPVRGVLVALDVTEKVIAEARSKKANLVVSHHPLLFHPAKAITTRSATGRCITALCRHGIALFSAHTNLDFTVGGTNTVLASKFQLRDTSFLRPAGSLGRKIVAFVPQSNVEEVAIAMANAGAGIIGEYTECSFQSKGVGTFRGSAMTHPAVGQAGRRERVREVRLEMSLPRWRTAAVIDALRAHHPYEEVAFDIYPMESASGEYGEGVIGMLPVPLSRDAFLTAVKRNLRVRSLRTSHGRTGRVRRVAVCGGSGSGLLDDAIRSGADALVTADVRYHAFQDAADRILLIDAGHFETERPVVDAIVARLRAECQRRGERIPVRAAAAGSNPVLIH